MTKKMRVAVLMGGFSSEREVSLISGRECVNALRSVGFDAFPIDAGHDLLHQLTETAPDVAFNALHGRWGEDGCVQGILEWLKIPYTHSGVRASAVAMDKDATKRFYRFAGLPTPDGHLVNSRTARISHLMEPPYVLKPVNEGSSVGVNFVFPGDVPIIEDPAPEFLMIEKYVPGRELTVSVLGDRAITVTDIVTREWYDYDAKYSDGGSQHILPAELPADVFSACMAHARTAHDLLGCRGLSRTDFRWDEKLGLAGLFLLETNTQPGMTPVSLSPEQANHAGIDFGSLCRTLVEDASCNR